MPKINFNSVVIFSFAAVTFFIIGKHVNLRTDPVFSPVLIENNEFYRNSVSLRSTHSDIVTEIRDAITTKSTKRLNNSQQKYSKNATTESIGLATVKNINNILNYLPVTHLQYQNVTECGCLRPFFYPTPESGTKRLNSTCSDNGSFYQIGQKIITMSLYFKTPSNRSSLQTLYTEGLQVNLERIKAFYPGHTFRLYTDVKLEGEFCDIYCKNPALLWCDIRKTPALGDQSKMFFMSWRFLALGDETVDYFLSRDLDSAIIEREVAVVRDWLQNSKKAFHAMRDKLKGHNIPILGGMWGGSNTRLGYTEAGKLQKKIIKSSKTPGKYIKKGGDQYSLNDVIFYPLGKKSIVAYDSYHCKQYRKFSEVRPFPTKREDNHFAFVGNVKLGKQFFNLSECPVECRPKYGKEWTNC